MTGPISTKRGLARDDAAAAARDPPRGVASPGLRRLGEREVERLADRDEAVEEAARQHDVVVDDEQPVALGRVAPLEHRVQVLELAALEVLGDRQLAQLGAPCTARAEDELDVVVGAAQLRRPRGVIRSRLAP